jgi:6,7-dimethyl-8-ribityllumazine synthase
LTVENNTQAEVRAAKDGQNKGGRAAEAALHLIALTHRFLKKTKRIGFKPASEHIFMAGNSKDTTTE